MKNLKIIFLSLVVLSIAACELTVNVDLPEHESMLVVNAILIKDRPLLVEVTKSKPILEDSFHVFERLEEAEVKIVRNGIDTFIMSYETSIRQFANSNLTSAKIGSTYEVFVSYPNFESTYAKTTVPVPVEISNFEIEKDVETDVDGNTLSRVRFDIQDPPDERNYYSLSLGLVDSSNVPFSICYQSSDPVLSGQTDPLSDQARPEYCGGDHFTDNLMTDSPYQMEIYFIDDYFSGIDSFFVQLTTFDEASYLYERSLLQQQSTSGNPFAEPVIVYNNIENGLGIFGSRSQFENRVKW